MWNVCSLTLIKHYICCVRLWEGLYSSQGEKGVISNYRNLTHLIVHRSGTFPRELQLSSCRNKAPSTITYCEGLDKGKAINSPEQPPCQKLYGNGLGGVFGFGHCLFKALQLEAKEEARTKYQLWKEIWHSSHDTSSQPTDTYGTACPVWSCQLSYSGLWASTCYR